MNEMDGFGIFSYCIELQPNLERQLLCQDRLIDDHFRYCVLERSKPQRTQPSDMKEMSRNLYRVIGDIHNINLLELK